MRHLLFFVFSLLFINVGLAQDSYTADQLQSFVDIYMDAKNTKPIDTYENIIIDKLAEHQISNARYREIFQSNILEEEIILNKNEKAFFNELQQSEEKLSKEQDAKLSADCTSKSMSYEAFKEIREKYKTDIKFQRSLKPYFEHYLNNKK